MRGNYFISIVMLKNVVQKNHISLRRCHSRNKSIIDTVHWPARNSLKNFLEHHIEIKKITYSLENH